MCCLKYSIKKKKINKILDTHHTKNIGFSNTHYKNCTRDYYFPNENSTRFIEMLNDIHSDVTAVL